MYSQNTTSPAIYGLPAKARCITSQLGETEKNRFLVGTLTLREDNEIHLIEVRENEREKDIVCVNIFTHPCEIWSLTASPSNPSLFFTCYNTGVDFKASLWAIRENSPTLDEKLELKPHSGIIRSVLWDVAGKSDYVVSIDESNVRLFDLDANFSNPKATSTIPTSQGRNITGALDPLHANMVAVAIDGSIKGYDFRAPKEAYAIEKAHMEGVRDIDFNPNKAYYFVSGGDDTKLKFWDVRNTKEPIKTLPGHSHWVWSQKTIPRYQDQLVISSSSDNTVKLWNMESISSSNKSAALDEDAETAPIPVPVPAPKTQKGKKQEDSLIKTFEEHEDSVYSLAWGAATTWLFASLSYDGRVVVNYVPKEYADITRY